MEKLILTGKNLTLKDLFEVVYDNRQVEVSPDAWEKVRQARQIMKELSDGGKAIYGYNRGVGWNKDQVLDTEHLEEYNRQLVYSHSLGVGPYHNDDEVKMMMVIRLNNILIGASCATDDLIRIFTDYVNHSICPRVPTRGSVGEADITALSHLGLAFLGEGTVSYKGRIMPSMEAMNEAGIKPCILNGKDGHSIILSNAQGEAMAAKIVKEAEELVHTSNLLYSLAYEGLNGNVESMREDVNRIRGIKGQITCAAMCRKFLEGSYLHESDSTRALQDPLSFRGAFAINGTVLDALDYVKNILETQINSPADNPCIVQEQRNLYVTSNFETTSLVVGVEMVAIALAHMSRCTNYRMVRLSDPAFTKLPRFLAPHGTDVLAYATTMNTYSALDAENRSLCNPSSVDFYAQEGCIEDHASNLPLAGQKVMKLIDNLKYLVGLEGVYAAQAVDLRDNVKLGKYTQVAHDVIREHIPFLSQDRVIHHDLETAHELMCSRELYLKTLD